VQNRLWTLLTRAAAALGFRARSAPLLLSGRNPMDVGGAQSAKMPLPVRTQWLLEQIGEAQRMADGGNLYLVAALAEAMRLDGLYSGLLSTRTDGLVILPRTLAGRTWDGQKVDALHPLLARLEDDYDLLCPPGELAAFQADYDIAGVGLAELCWRRGKLTLVRHRLDRLMWSWGDRKWRLDGEVIHPGDGRWVLHQRTEIAPWNRGAWYACARAFVSKDHAFHLRENYSHKLANPARIAKSPTNATSTEILEWFQQVAAWGIDTVFAMKPGWDVDLLESTGQGYQVFAETIKTANEDLMIALSGQTVTTEGGAGFSNSSIHEAIRSDIIQFGASGLARTLIDQVLPWWQLENAWDAESRGLDIRVAYDTTSPADIKRAAETGTIAFQGLASAQTAGVLGRVDVDAYLAKCGIPLLPAAYRVNAPPPALPTTRRVRQLVAPPRREAPAVPLAPSRVAA